MSADLPAWALDLWRQCGAEIAAVLSEPDRGYRPRGPKSLQKHLGTRFSLPGERRLRHVVRWYREGAFPELTAEDGAPRVEIESDGESGLAVNVRGQGLVMSVADLVAVSELDLSAWRVVKHVVNTWTTTIRGSDGEPQIVRNWQVKAWCERRRDAGSAPPPVLSVHAREAPPVPRPADVELCLIIPDPQIGYRRGRDGLLEPLHDRRVLDLALQLASAWQPDLIVCLGDVFDFAELSTKYPTPVSMLDTTQPSIAEGRWWLATFRATAPNAEIVVIEGNHDLRLSTAARNAAPALEVVQGVADAAPALDLGACSLWKI